MPRALLKRMAVAAVLAVLAASLGGCWQAAAARAAKKRTRETGVVVGTVEQAAGVADPLQRQQRTLVSQ